MKANKHSQIEDLARLAREGCAYRGRSQQADAPLSSPTVEKSEYSNRPIQRLVAAFKN